MKRIAPQLTILLLLHSILSFVLFPTIGISQTTPSPQQVVKPGIPFGLLDGTPIKLRTTRTLSSGDAKTGDMVDFEVLEDVKLDDLLIVPRGGLAIGTITRAKPKGRFGKGGKLDITIDSVRLISGEKVALRAVKETKGGSHTGAMTGAMVATGLLFFPVAPLFLFLKGNNITIPKGTEITAYVNGDASLERSKFTPAKTEIPVPDATPASSALPDGTSGISVKSSPDGAEILVNGVYAGSTPSTLMLKPGEHLILIKKAGYVDWERTLTLVSGSSITIDAALEKKPQ